MSDARIESLSDVKSAASAAAGKINALEHSTEYTQDSRFALP